MVNELLPVAMAVPSKESVQVYTDSPEVPMRMVVVGCLLAPLEDGGLYGQVRTIRWVLVPLVTGTRKAPIGVVVEDPRVLGLKEGWPP